MPSIVVTSPPTARACAPRSPSPQASRKRPPSSELCFIEGFLAVGCEQMAHNVDLLRLENVTHILNLTATAFHPEVCKSANFKWKRIELRDSLSENLLVHLQDAFAFIDDARACGGRILIHCYAGISRSVAVAIAYIMWLRKLSLSTAVDLVQHHRECASPNLNFMGQLLLLEKTLLPADGQVALCSPTATRNMALLSAWGEHVSSCPDAKSVTVP